MTIPLPPVPGPEISPKNFLTPPWHSWFTQLYIYLTATKAGGGGIVGGAGGGGTLTSLSAGDGLTASPSPITATGTISLQNRFADTFLMMGA